MSYLPADLAESAVGLMVFSDGPDESARPHPARLIRVKGATAWVQPGGHRHSVPVPADRLKLFKKGNHDLGGECMSRHERIERIATLRATLGDRKNVRGFTVQEAHAWLSSGENPVVLCELEPRNYLPARLISIRGDQCVVAPIGSDMPPQQWPLIETFIENGIKTSQEDWNLLAKSLDEKIRARFVKKPEPPVSEQQRPVAPAPKPAPPKPQTQLIVQTPVETPPEHSLKNHPPAVIVCMATKMFWAKEAGTGPRPAQWSTDPNDALVYTRSDNAARAIGRMGTDTLKGRQLEVVAIEKAKWLADMWNRKGTPASQTWTASNKPGARPPKWIASHTAFRNARPKSKADDNLAGSLMSHWVREGAVPAGAFKDVRRADSLGLYDIAGSPRVRIYDHHFLEDCGFYRVQNEIDQQIADGVISTKGTILPRWTPDGAMIPARSKSEFIRDGIAAAKAQKAGKPVAATPPTAAPQIIEPLRIVEKPSPKTAETVKVAPKPENLPAVVRPALVMSAKDKYRRAMLDKAQAEALRLQAEAEMVMARAEMEAEAL